MSKAKIHLNEAKYFKQAVTRTTEEFAKDFGVTTHAFFSFLQRRGWPPPREVRMMDRLNRLQQFLNEGLSPKQICQSLGISHQRYHQMLNELKERPVQPKVEPAKPTRAKSRSGADPIQDDNFVCHLRRTMYEIVQGLWNPRDSKYSWIVVDDGLTIKEAREQVDEFIAEQQGLGRLQRVTSEHRKAYVGPPLAIIEVSTKIVERIGTIEPPKMFVEEPEELEAEA
jgi:hypothetical protein